MQRRNTLIQLATTLAVSLTASLLPLSTLA